MRARKTLKPGQHGTKNLLDQYGDQLICVRYRYDEERKLRHKTVELIVESTSWIPQDESIPPDSIVGVRVELNEINLQRRLRQAGGIWNRQLRLWQIRYDQAVALKLEDRIEPSTLSNSRKRNGATGKNGDLSTIRH
ncbi:MAG: hypothetical protein JNJ50_08735 [Acidobacteria bacterium]|nr:hypothetical protein [Acidobacteriota bacterium]